MVAEQTKNSDLYELSDDIIYVGQKETNPRRMQNERTSNSNLYTTYFTQY